MKLHKGKLKELARARGESLTRVLSRASISRTAYYNLLSKKELLPASVYRLAEALGVEPLDFLEKSDSPEGRMRKKMLFVYGMAKQDPLFDVGTALNTLRLLDMSPIERLEHGLRYGQAAASYR